MTNGLGLVWIKCPIRVANRLAAVGWMRMGWTMVRVELLDKRPIQCFRCWEYGHARFSCKSVKDRRDCCYNCGEPGHTASKCDRNRPTCIICKEKGYEANHRLGSKWCRIGRAPDVNRKSRRGREAGGIRRSGESGENMDGIEVEEEDRIENRMGIGGEREMIQ